MVLVESIALNPRARAAQAPDGVKDGLREAYTGRIRPAASFSTRDNSICASTFCTSAGGEQAGLLTTFR
jgi:hypothetical protein